MKKNRMKQVGGMIVAFLMTFLVLQSGMFYTWDKTLSDKLYQWGTVPDNRIFILGIDDQTLQEYGPMAHWSRDIYTDTVNILNGDKKPAVIAFDIMFLEEDNIEADQRFAEVCRKGGNVVTAFNLQFKEHPELNARGKMVLNPFYVSEVDYPYHALKNSADYGFANTVVDRDGYVRRFLQQTNADGETFYNLGTATYLKYMEITGGHAVLPGNEKDPLIPFQYACRCGGYSVISLKDLLNGKVNPDIFEGGIVYIGAYAAGLFDSYAPAISHGSQMYGVEVQANITDALLNGNVQQETSGILYALLAGVLTAAFYLISRKIKTVKAAILMVLLGVSSVIASRILFENGYILPVLGLPLMLLLTYIASVVIGYVEEIHRRHQIIGVFKQYMAPQIVDKISRQKDFKVELGGEKRHIAVLFVDIRGFTTMSESLKAEEVVEILNQYLALTTDSIFKNSGTLDKFIGDATMAVFNAPLDLEDYVFKAVKTAWDMKSGAEELAVKLEKRFNKRVSFGIGINCGDAVVGNIGCQFRMDYTAIGDTVNTASRLESNAKPGQILISQAVYDRVKDRIQASPIGEIPLKGKAKGVFVYQVDALLCGEEQ